MNASLIAGRVALSPLASDLGAGANPADPGAVPTTDHQDRFALPSRAATVSAEAIAMVAAMAKPELCRCVDSAGTEQVAGSPGVPAGEYCRHCGQLVKTTETEVERVLYEVCDLLLEALKGPPRCRCKPKPGQIAPTPPPSALSTTPVGT